MTIYIQNGWLYIVLGNDTHAYRLTGITSVDVEASASLRERTIIKIAAGADRLSIPIGVPSDDFSTQKTTADAIAENIRAAIILGSNNPDLTA